MSYGFAEGFEPTPHVVLKLPSREQMAAMASTDEGAAELMDWLKRREERIQLMETDPYRYGWESDTWKLADEIIESRGEALLPPADLKNRVVELLLMGGNRSGKSEYCAKRIVKTMLEKPGAIVACFHDTNQTSIGQQQSRIYKYLPEELRNLGKPKGDRVTNVSYTQKNGFSENTFILPNGSQCFFFNYAQDLSVLEGWELDGCWCDELVPRAFVEALRFRVMTRKGYLLLSFTPVDGYTATVKDYLAGALPLRWEKAPLLPQDVELVKGCPPGHMPRVMRCEKRKRMVLFFFTSDNPFNPYEEMEAECRGETRERIMLRAYGWTEKLATSAFPKFHPPVHVITEEQYQRSIKNGVTYFCSCDPAPAKNWFIKWYAATPEGHLILFKEWPDYDRFGEWALPSDKIDWRAGPAQRADAGRGLRSYKELIMGEEGWQWLDDHWDGSTAYVIHMRTMDPRMGGSPTPSSDDGHTLISILDTDEMDSRGNLRWPAMVWERGAGGRVMSKDADNAVQILNDLMDYNESEPISSVNCPRFYVHERCKQSILAYGEWSGMGSQACALKDIVDPDRYLVTMDPQYVEPGMFGTQGGGYY